MLVHHLLIVPAFGDGIRGERRFLLRGHHFHSFQCRHACGENAVVPYACFGVAVHDRGSYFMLENR